MKNIFVLFSILFSLLISMLSLPTKAQEVPADWEFITLRTAHFDVIVNARQQDLGQLYAEKLEKAYSFLSKIFSDTPERTVIIVNDNTDVTNGYATKIPYSHIMAFPVLPGPSDSLSESGDWTLELLAHEYTHIITFEPARGVFKALRYGLGSIISPNILLPTWWKEGLAVHIESQISRGGRLRSLYQDATLRSFVKAGRLGEFDLAKANEVLPTWPEGHRPYLFGSLIWSQMVAKNGNQVAEKLNHQYGGRMPYFINGPAEDNLGMSYADQYAEMLQETETRVKQQIAVLESKPTTNFEYLNLKTQYLNHPAISDDGRYMAVISVDETDKREVKLLERKSGQTFNQGEVFKKVGTFKEDQRPPTPQDAPPTGSIQRIGWFHHSPKLVYDKIDNINRLERYADLHVYDLESQKSEPITKGLRGREPSVAPDDGEIVFVKLEGGKTALAIYDLSSKSEKILWQPALQSRISYPVFLDSNRIIFSLRTPSGEEGLWIFDRSNQTVNRILTSFKTARFPTLTPQGLFFTSSDNGVHNLYLADKDLSHAQPVTHVLTAVFSSTYDPTNQDLYLTTMTADGPSVGRIAAADWQNSRAPLPTVKNLFADRYPVSVAPEIEPESPKNVVESKENYSSLMNLWPHYWIPSLGTSTLDNSVIFSASTSGFDPLKKHVYSLTATYETGIKRGSIIGAYQNNQSPWPILLQSSDFNSYLYSPDNLVHNTSALLSVWPDIWKINRYSLFELGVKYQKTEYKDTLKATRHGSQARYVYSNYLKSGTQISPEAGQSLYLGATDYYFNTDDLRHTQYTMGGSSYFSKWLPSRHALMIKANGYYVEENLNPVYGATTTPVMPLQDFSVPVYIMRGYPTGEFFGRKLYNCNLEYRFPLTSIYWGHGTHPYFLRRLHGALIADGVAVDGYAFNRKTEVFEKMELERQFWSYGIEARLETTIGYVLPLNMILGLYTVQDDKYSAKSSAAFNIQMNSMF